MAQLAPHIDKTNSALKDKFLDEAKFYKVCIIGRDLKYVFTLRSALKVKWTRVPDLVERRRVFLKGGFAYVPESEQSSIVFQEFQTNLNKALEVKVPALTLCHLV